MSRSRPSLACRARVELSVRSGVVWPIDRLRTYTIIVHRTGAANEDDDGQAFWQCGSAFTQFLDQCFESRANGPRFGPVFMRLGGSASVPDSKACASCYSNCSHSRTSRASITSNLLDTVTAGPSFSRPYGWPTIIIVGDALYVHEATVQHRWARSQVGRASIA